MELIYFSKVEYVEYLGYDEKPRKTILLDLDNGELSYQEVEWTRQMPAILKTRNYSIGDDRISFEYGVPARIMHSGSSNFEGQFLECDAWDCKVIFSWGIKLSAEQMKELLPYCNALDFEPYRNKKMSMSDEGYIGYRDEISTYFTAVTNSYLPRIELPMDYYYDEEHIWPNEKLYRYLIMTFFENEKNLRSRGITYGGHSLIWG